MPNFVQAVWLYHDRTFVCDTINVTPDPPNPPLAYLVKWKLQGQTRFMASDDIWWNDEMMMSDTQEFVTDLAQWTVELNAQAVLGNASRWTDPDGYPGEQFWLVVIEDQATRDAWQEASQSFWESNDGASCCEHHVNRITATGQIPDFVIANVVRHPGDDASFDVKLGNIDDGSDFTEDGTFTCYWQETGSEVVNSDDFTKLDQIDQEVEFNASLSSTEAYTVWVRKSGWLRSGLHNIPIV